MAHKENKGGNLKNEQIEKDLQAKGKTPDKNDVYAGAQDTGDKTLRQMGNEVQRADGRPAETDENGET